MINHHRLAGLLVIIAVGTFIAGYYLSASNPHATFDEQIQAWRTQINDIKGIREHERALLVIKLASLESQVKRLQSLGSHLIDRYDVDKEEFEFIDQPGIGGGMENDQKLESAPQTQLDSVSRRLERRLADTQIKLDLLSDTLAKIKVKKDERLSGLPTDKLLISSPYDYRINPFTHRREFHRAVDIAGREGDVIRTIAGGVVKRTGYYRYYGNLVEIEHVDGYSTLYAHNQHILVNKGDVVKKGQVIALMGNTGRSTNPHLHFEVIKNDKRVNPEQFIRQHRR